MDISTAQDEVFIWQKKVHHPHSTTPTNVSIEDALLQARLLTEEGVTEYLDAVAANDLVAIEDALGDALWIVLRGFVMHGIDADTVFRIISDSNYSKFDENGNPVPHPTIPGKIGKSEFFWEPTEQLTEYTKNALKERE